MSRARVAAAFVLVAWPATAGALDGRLQLEPLHVGATRLDAMYANVAGVESRGAMRLGLGAAWAWHPRFSVAVQLGRGALHTDFGLLEGPTVRLERADTALELRGRALTLGRWALQAGVGVGRLTLRYDPERVRFDVGGVSVDVQLDDVGTWTRHVAAELLHELPGSASLAFRTAWSFYVLDVATPNGTQERAVRDLHVGLALRVPVR